MADTAARELNFPNHIYYATETHFRTVRPIDESMKWFYHNAVGGVDLIPVFFDGGDLLRRFGPLTGEVDGPNISISIAFNTEASGLQDIVHSPGNRISVNVTTLGKLRISLEDSTGTTIYDAETFSTVNDGVDHVLAFFYDGVAGKGELFLDDVPDEVPTIETTGIIDFTTGDFTIADAVG